MTENKLIPFSLERALEGDPVVTRNGIRVNEIHLFKTDKIYPIGAILREDEDIYHECYTINGKYMEDGHESELDLFMLPKIKTLWVNIYKNEFGYFTCRDTYSTEADAIEAARGTFCYIKTISFEVEI